MSAKNWCFTYNNPFLQVLNAEPGMAPLSLCDSHVQFTRGIPDALSETCTYGVLQLERGASGTIHYQGYLQFATRKTLSSVKSITLMTFPGAHWEKAKGTPKQATDYCTKDDTRVEGTHPVTFGTMNTAGKRTDLDEFMIAHKNGLTMDDIYEQFPSIIAKYPRFVRDVERRKRRRISELLVPRPGWQTELTSLLFSPTDQRTVNWYYDETGNTGKSYFARTFGGGIGYVITGGKHQDIFYAYNYESTVFFDWPRTAEEQFPYGVAEAFKNGYFLSTKYESSTVRFQPPHVVILANFLPDQTKLSQDRWRINTIK